MKIFNVSDALQHSTRRLVWACTLVKCMNLGGKSILKKCETIIAAMCAKKTQEKNTNFQEYKLVESVICPKCPKVLSKPKF